jgi:hypothetical protein
LHTLARLDAKSLIVKPFGGRSGAEAYCFASGEISIL